jgi:dTDP-4-amino-4,6-dideoxygalactose transaminase
MQKISWWRTSIGEDEVRSLLNAISHEHLGQGPVVAELERKIGEALGVPYVVLTTSGSVALLLAVMALDIERGDEVIVPNRTWIATAHAPLMVGAKVVIIDVSPDIPVMDASLIRKKINSRTKVIMPVHLNGRADDMDEINTIAKEYGLKVIEDVAQAMFSKNQAGLLGTQSDMGCFSLGVAKLITTGQGGFVVTRDKDIYEKLVLIRNHGLINNFAPTFFRVGCNFRLTDMLAAIGIGQLNHAQERINHVTTIYKMYEDGIKDLPFIRIIPVKTSEGELPLYAEVMSEKRDELMKFLASNGIESRPFLPNVNDAKYIESDGNFPNSEIFKAQGMTLPCGPEQPLENVERVIESIRRFK